MPVWVFLLALTIVTIAVSWRDGDGWAVRAGVIILVAYGAMRLENIIFAESQFTYVARAVIWVAAAVAIPRQNGRKTTQIKGLLALVALCYLWARLVNAPRVFGSPPLVASDLLAALALIGIGWRGYVGLFDRIRGMVRGSYRRAMPDYSNTDFEVKE